MRIYWPVIIFVLKKTVEPKQKKTPLIHFENRSMNFWFVIDSKKSCNFPYLLWWRLALFQRRTNSFKLLWSDFAKCCKTKYNYKLHIALTFIATKRLLSISINNLFINFHTPKHCNAFSTDSLQFVIKLDDRKKIEHCTNSKRKPR